MIHNPRGTILVRFLWPFYHTLLMLRGKDEEFPRNQQKSRVIIVAIILYVYKKEYHSGMWLSRNIAFLVQICHLLDDLGYIISLHLGFLICKVRLLDWLGIMNRSGVGKALTTVLGRKRSVHGAVGGREGEEKEVGRTPAHAYQRTSGERFPAGLNVIYDS